MRAPRRRTGRRPTRVTRLASSCGDRTPSTSRTAGRDTNGRSATRRSRLPALRSAGPTPRGSLLPRAVFDTRALPRRCRRTARATRKHREFPTSAISSRARRESEPAPERPPRAVLRNPSRPRRDWSKFPTTARCERRDATILAEGVSRADAICVRGDAVELEQRRTATHVPACHLPIRMGREIELLLNSIASYSGARV